MVLSTFLYTNDNDDRLGDCPADGMATETYVFMARLEPYMKNNSITKCPASPYQMGSVQHNQHDVPSSLGGGYYITPPSDPCVGLGVSKYGTSDSASSNYFNDYYPPTDYGMNPVLFGYVGSGCPHGGVTNGYSHPGASVTSGNSVSGANGNNNFGINGLGPGSVTYTSISKVPLMYDFPTDNNRWPGPAFWGAAYNGMFNGQCNISFLDGHSKSFPIAKMLAGTPGSINAAAYPYNGNIVTEENWNPPYDGVNQAFGQKFIWWGTQLADTANQ